MALEPHIEQWTLGMLGDTDPECYDFVVLGAAAKALCEMGVPSKVLMCSLTLNPDEPRNASNLSFMITLQVGDTIFAGPGRYGWGEAVKNELRSHGLPDDHVYQLLEKPTHMNWMMICAMLDDEQKEQMKEATQRCNAVKLAGHTTPRAQVGLAL